MKVGLTECEMVGPMAVYSAGRMAVMRAALLAESSVDETVAK